jgi:transposase
MPCVRSGFVGYFGAVRLCDGKLVYRRETTRFNAETCFDFLWHLRRVSSRSGRRVVVTTDNARYHHAALHKKWRKAAEPWFRLEYLPPYSPNLNPIERVWKLTRRLATHNRYFPAIEDLITTVEHTFESWRKGSDALRHLCAITEDAAHVERLQAADSNIVPVHGPVHASWVIQIEIYFSIIQRKVLTPNDFSSLEDVQPQRPQQYLNFLPLPQGQGELRPGFRPNKSPSICSCPRLSRACNSGSSSSGSPSSPKSSLDLILITPGLGVSLGAA